MTVTTWGTAPGEKGFRTGGTRKPAVAVGVPTTMPDGTVTVMIPAVTGSAPGGLFSVASRLRGSPRLTVPFPGVKVNDGWAGTTSKLRDSPVIVSVIGPPVPVGS